MRNYHDEIDEIRRLDPIDGTRLRDSWSDSEAKRALFQKITGARARQAATSMPKLHRRLVPRRALILAATLAVTGVAIVLVSGILQRTSTPAFAVRELPNGVIEIENVADLHDAQGLEAELREFGIDAEIVTETASPSMVGNAQAFTPGLGDRRLPGLTFGEDGTPEVFRWRIDPKVFRDRITITLYIEAHEGEAYYNAEEVFEPGEVLGGLQCALGQPLRAADVAARLPEVGVTPEWYVLTDFQSDASGGTSSSKQVDEVPEGEVMSGYALDDHTVRFDVVPDNVTAPEWQQPRLSDVPCTDEQAGRWR